MRDLRYALRSMASAKKFAAIVIATLALGIGANTAVFGVLNAVVLTPIPYWVQSGDVMTFEVHLPSGRYADAERRAQFHREFQDRLAALPGVRGAAAVSRLPVTGSYHSWGTGRPDLPPGTRGAQGQQRIIEGAYFEALGIPLLRGRTFGPEDTVTAPRHFVVSREMVRQLFGDEDPLGKRLRAGGAEGQIVGVVGDVAITRRATPQPYVYHSHSQFAANRNWSLTQVVSLDHPLPDLLAEVRRELAAIDPALVLHQPRALADVVGGGIAQERFALLLIAAFALLALVLAAIGIYGVLSYSVSRRSREMGIRMALGAPASAVRSLIVKDGGRLALAGVTLGLLGAYATTRTATQSLIPHP